MKGFTTSLKATNSDAQCLHGGIINQQPSSEYKSRICNVSPHAFTDFRGCPRSLLCARNSR